MRVAMVTPMSAESAIADVMVQAVPALSEEWDLEIWCPTEPSTRPCPVPVHSYAEANADVLHSLREYDLVVYVLGNSPWHSRILPLARAHPGLVVLHDVAMTDLVRYTAIERDDLEALTARVTEDHGDEHGRTFRTAAGAEGPDAWLRFCAEVPLFEEAVEGSLGVIVHSMWHADIVDGHSLGGVTVAPLPVPSAKVGFDDAHDGSVAGRLDALADDIVLLVTVGAVNANRRVDLLLRAIADDRLDRRVHLWAVGPSEPRHTQELQRIARSLGVADRFMVTGRVTDALLHDILARADVAAALRDPVLEGQSASVLTQLLSGTPAIVYDHAHYAELPDDVAVKIAPADAQRELVAAIAALAADEEARAVRGQRGRDYVLTNRSGTAYAAALLEAGERALASRPLVSMAAHLSRRLGRVGLHQHPVVVDTTARLAFELFDLA